MRPARAESASPRLSWGGSSSGYSSSPRSSLSSFSSSFSWRGKSTETHWSHKEGEPRKTRHGSVISVDEEPLDALSQKKAALVEALKKEVKVVMEEAASRERVSLSCVYVTSLCAAVDACLQDGLRKRVLGLVGYRTSFALLHAVAKGFPPAEEVLRVVSEQSRLGESATFSWIREALAQRLLAQIVDFIASSTSTQRLYEKTALMADRARSGMVAALLRGPCAVHFRRVSGAMWTEPDAKELVDRQRLPSHPPSSPRPPLATTRRMLSSGDGSFSWTSLGGGRDFVFALHQNFKTSLLYGKNNVSVATGEESVRGYLALYKTHTGALSLKWTPNELMHASSQPSTAPADSQWLWRQVLNIDLAQVIYIHLHQKDDDSPASLICVKSDGVQQPPLQFPAGPHSLFFLSCLDNGLQPSHRLDPPLWLNKNKEKTLPRLRRRTRTANGSEAASPSDSSTSSQAEAPLLDYVFRIVAIEAAPLDKFLDQLASPPPSPTARKPSGRSSSCVDEVVQRNMDEACRSMRLQILGRAFFGWLAFCRHLRTIRSQLFFLVDAKERPLPEDLREVDADFWRACRRTHTKEQEEEFLLRVYWKGIADDDVRREAWPFLLRLFDWDEEPEKKTGEMKARFEADAASWKRLEVIVRERDEHAFHQARRHKLSQEASLPQQTSMNSEVFEEESPKSPVDADPEQEDEVALFGANLHRIEKDVERCDRTLPFFSKRENLEKLSSIMCTYVYRNLEEGYVQGMCDIAAPLLVLFEDEPMALGCFTVLMQRLRENFPQRTGMDENLANMRSLIQVLDPQLSSLLMQTADFTQLYFSYRWFLLDFKRELSYAHVFRVWETIWASGRTFSSHFPLFFALALLTHYREAILSNNMDFTDLIKFFNEMAERHDALQLLNTARGHVSALRSLVAQLQ